MNHKNSTRGREQDEDACGGHDSVEDACAAVGQRASSPTAAEPADAGRKPVKIRAPRGFLDADLDDGEVQRTLLSCSVAALARAGFEITDEGRTRLVRGILARLRSVDRRTLVRDVETTLDHVMTDESMWGQVVVPVHGRTDHPGRPGR